MYGYYCLNEIVFTHCKIFGCGMNFNSTRSCANSESIEDSLQNLLAFSTLQTTSSLLEIQKSVPVISDDEAILALSSIYLNIIVVPIEIRSGNLGPTIYLPNNRLVAEPAPVTINKRVNLIHVNRPFTKFGA